MKKSSTIVLAALMLLALFSASAVAQSESRDDVIKQIAAKRVELSALEDKFLAPSEEDRAAYADFLKQPNAGLIRLLPREVYESETYRKNQKTIVMRGGGAYYSFSRLTHEYGYGSDIGLEGGHLSAGFAGADYGILTRLGNVPVEEVSLEHSAAQFLASYNPPAELPKARVEQQRFGGLGITIDNEVYLRRVPVEVNTTYLVRSISYDTSDVLVVFRIIRKDTDGSVIIVWKMLKNYPKPELARNTTNEQ